MKLNIKHSVGKLAHINVRVPPPLKQRIEGARARAEALNVDFTLTLIAMLDEFITELDGRLDAEEHPAKATEDSVGISPESPIRNTNGTSTK